MRSGNGWRCGMRTAAGVAINMRQYHSAPSYSAGSPQWMHAGP